jgi:hypothetical protein
VANVQAIRQALATRLQTQLGITTTANVPAIITPPAIFILGGMPYIQYGATMGETADALGAVLGPVATPMSKNSIMLSVLICISVAQGYEPMQPALDILLEPAGNSGSIPDAIALDETLGGVVDFAVPLDCTPPNLINVGGQDYFGSHLRVQVGA